MVSVLSLSNDIYDDLKNPPVLFPRIPARKNRTEG